jgi:hypothetical protein
MPEPPPGKGIAPGHRNRLQVLESDPDTGVAHGYLDRPLMPRPPQLMESPPGTGPAADRTRVGTANADENSCWLLAAVLPTDSLQKKA